MIEDQKTYSAEKYKIIAAIGLNKNKFPELRQILEGAFTVCDSDTVDEALALLDESLELIMAVVFDADMTKDEGFALFERMDADKRYVEIPMIGAASEYDDALRSVCISKGVNEYFEPPFRRDMIPIRIKNAARAKDSVTFREMENMLKELPSNIYFKDAEGKYIFSSHYWHHLSVSRNTGWIIRGKTDFDIQKDQDVAQKRLTPTSAS